MDGKERAAVAEFSADCVDALVGWVRGLHDCVVEPGLDDSELSGAETEFQLTFTPLWREVLRKVHPISLPIAPRTEDGVLRSASYPDWRQRDADAVRKHITAPVDGVLFDVEHNGFWWRSWGLQPEVMSDRLATASLRLAAVPRLTPIRGNWYVGEQIDSPVLSIVQTDLWSPAVTLCDIPTGRDESDVPIEDYPLGQIPFWSELHAWSQIGHTSRFGELAE